MGICCAFIRLSDRNVEALIRQPKLVYPFLHIDLSEIPPDPLGGFFGRLFGLTKQKSSPPEPLTLPDPREEDDEGDVDKAWQGLHYVLTGEAKETDNPLGFLYCGGVTLKGMDVGYGPPRVYTSNEAAGIFAELNKLDRETLYQRYKPEDMDKQKVYPKIWVRDGDDGYDYIWQNFERLRELLAQAHRRKQGLLIWYT